ncbi:Zn finger protein HypA/HybF involved in hydrogenase expression [Alkalihalobacillus xiaoxiensis]|uniref:Zn finger protein HypA/HybF involved in hydrogenase expression n=1 Tax=Shouchella xiaoxiensis TaxID=766895 RepID=A0ABS2SUR8_9BACI|nr:Zn finger protein HypA/HybF involved in hydrogenase expression [Shouchella xiaoxiensis]
MQEHTAECANCGKVISGQQPTFTQCDHCLSKTEE